MPAVENSNRTVAPVYAGESAGEVLFWRSVVESEWGRRAVRPQEPVAEEMRRVAAELRKDDQKLVPV